MLKVKKENFINETRPHESGIKHVNRGLPQGLGGAFTFSIYPIPTFLQRGGIP